MHRLALLRLLAPSVMAIVMLSACAPADEEPTKPDGGGSDVPIAGPPTYKKDVQPILKRKCAPCHDGGDAGNHNLASNYADAMKPVETFDAMGCWKDDEMTMPKAVGECALISAKRGWMPYQMGCDMATPPNPDVCVSAAEIAILEKWVKAGMPE